MSTDPFAATTDPGGAARADAPDDSTPASAAYRQLEEERDRYLDQLQRNHAEFLNYQKRSKAQAEIDRQYAVESLARDLLEVLDNCERGAEAARTAGSASIADGFEIVHRQLLAALAKHGVEPIEALGRPFDPNLHEALVQRPATAESPEGTVSAVLGRGYTIKDRVLRPVKVAVSGS